MKTITILKTKKASGEICGWCKNPIFIGTEFVIEERATWFRGDDETYSIHEACYHREEAKERAKQEKQSKEIGAYLERHKNRLIDIEKTLLEKGVEIKKHNDDQQWVFNNQFDWWPNTGTLIDRKGKKRYQVSSKNKKELFSILKITFSEKYDNSSIEP